MTVYVDVQNEQRQESRADERSPIRQSAAKRAARAYSMAVRATEQFIVGLPGTPTHADLDRYASLIDRENAAWQVRREAFAALAVHDQAQMS
ncbi:hypothetical protein HDA40_007258 [Hamadaea flava]|uniref:Uncharacterized protein n=1 Tax=Hamadaea flava TaxID=1742688 RepID=A0ABV8LTB6_9ACTN|nr:hypothetical protein [Hamadaea flava]MCP2328751.1 hypothetical protein [Hamadaea flava]